MKNFFGEWEKVINFSLLQETLRVIESKGKINFLCPKKQDVFKAFKLCPYNDLKVIIIGQDPYPQKGVATGLAFGNTKETKEEDISPSLKALKEAILSPEEDNTGFFFDNTLESWAKQGVLLLNSSLTTEQSNIGAHSSIWRAFIGNLLENISKQNPHVAYILFGVAAKTLKPYIKGASIIIEHEHPSYVLRQGKRFVCDAFTRVNEILLKNNNFKINWYYEKNINI